MEKKIISASYAVNAEVDGYSISANVRINANNEIENMDNGQIRKDGAFKASFNLLGESLNVNYHGLALEERNTVNVVIEEFKSSIMNN